MIDLLPHPLAELFPMLPDQEVRELADDIVTFGQRVPIVLLDGKILDGRNRYAACQFADVEPVTVDYEGDDPLNFVLSHNLHRRHLTESQRAMVAAKLATWRIGENRHTARPADLPVWKAAKMFSVSPRSVATAKVVIRDGTPELAHAVHAGEVAVSAAFSVSKKSVPEQRAFLRGSTNRGRRLLNGRILVECSYGDLPGIARRLERELYLVRHVLDHAANIPAETKVSALFSDSEIEDLWRCGRV